MHGGFRIWELRGLGEDENASVDASVMTPIRIGTDCGQISIPPRQQGWPPSLMLVRTETLLVYSFQLQ